MSLVGKTAPDFTLQAYHNGEIKEISLADYRGKWVFLLFYPLDFTFVCPTEVLKFGEMAAEFRARNCELLGISIDSQFVHKAWSRRLTRTAASVAAWTTRSSPTSTSRPHVTTTCFSRMQALRCAAFS